MISFLLRSYQSMHQCSAITKRKALSGTTLQEHHLTMYEYTHLFAICPARSYRQSGVY